MTSEELVTAACPKIGDMGWAYYFAPESVAVGEALGLDVFHFYALGRGGVLGDVESAVVASAFGYFNPAAIDAMWNAGKAIMAPRDAARAHWKCAADLGRSKFVDLSGLGAFCEAANAVHQAADPVGLSLYSAFKAEPIVEDLPGRAMQLVALLREFRGSVHLLAIRASGLDAKTAHFMRRPNDIGMFGWTDADAPEMGQAQVDGLAAADALTNAMVLPSYAVLDEAGASALLAGLDRIEAALAP